MHIRNGVKQLISLMLVVMILFVFSGGAFAAGNTENPAGSCNKIQLTASNIVENCELHQNLMLPYDSGEIELIDSTFPEDDMSTEVTGSWYWQTVTGLKGTTYYNKLILGQQNVYPNYLCMVRGDQHNYYDYNTGYVLRWDQLNWPHTNTEIKRYTSSTSNTLLQNVHIGFVHEQDGLYFLAYQSIGLHWYRYVKLYDWNIPPSQQVINWSQIRTLVTNVVETALQGAGIAVTAAVLAAIVDAIMAALYVAAVAI